MSYPARKPGLTSQGVRTTPAPSGVLFMRGRGLGLEKFRSPGAPPAASIPERRAAAAVNIGAQAALPGKPAPAHSAGQPSYYPPPGFKPGLRARPTPPDESKRIRTDHTDKAGADKLNVDRFVARGRVQEIMVEDGPDLNVTIEDPLAKNPGAYFRSGRGAAVLVLALATLIGYQLGGGIGAAAAAGGGFLLVGSELR